MLKEQVNEFLKQIFEPNRYQVNANLRGFYFSSGTQEGTPIDQVLGVMDRSFGQGPQFSQLSGLGKSYFLHDLITKVIFSETGWVSLDMGAVRRSKVIRWGLSGVIAVVTVRPPRARGAGAISTTSSSSPTPISSSPTTGSMPASELEATTVADFDVMKVLPALNDDRDDAGRLRPSRPSRYADRRRLRPQPARPAVRHPGRPPIAQALERMFRSRLILRLERQIEETINDPMAAYEALKVYMMLGGVAPETNSDLIVAWMKADWDEPLSRSQQPSGARRARKAPPRHARARCRPPPEL